MARRPVFLSTDEGFPREELIEFKWCPGLSRTQKRQSIKNLHTAAKEFLEQEGKIKGVRILEISTKSEEPAGRAASAFNLKMEYNGGRYSGRYSVEKIFQAGKVFEGNRQYIDILERSSLDAKRDERIRSGGKLICFKFGDTEWPLEPKTVFYDWLYIKALLDEKNKNLREEILSFDAFTDIEFNPEKSINCQARSAALFVSLYRKYKDTEKIRQRLSQKKFMKLYLARDKAVPKQSLEQGSLLNN